MKSFKQYCEDFTFKVDVEGLPSMFMTGNSPGQVKAHLRKLVKQPSMVQGVKRVTKHDKKKEFRQRAMEEMSHSQDEGKPGARKKAAKMTPGQVGENRRDRLRAKLAAVGKDMKKTADELKKHTDDYNRRFGKEAEKQNTKRVEGFMDMVKSAGATVKKQFTGRSATFTGGAGKVKSASQMRATSTKSPRGAR